MYYLTKCGCRIHEDDMVMKNQIMYCPEHGARIVGRSDTCPDCGKIYNFGIRGNRKLRCEPCAKIHLKEIKNRRKEAMILAESHPCKHFKTLCGYVCIRPAMPCKMEELK